VNEEQKGQGSSSDQDSSAKVEGPKQGGESADAQLTDRAQMSWLLSTTVERVQAVLTATDDAAAKIRDDAQTEADRFLEDARRRAESLTRERMDRIATLTEDLMAQASGVQQQSQALREALERATAELNRDLGGAQSETATAPMAQATPSPNPEPQQAAADASQQSPPSQAKTEEAESHGGLRERIGLRRKQDDSEGGVSEGARVLALQQLMAGADRKTVEETLTKDFGIEDPSVILDSLEPHVRG
jgi:hypothetical protein